MATNRDDLFSSLDNLQTFTTALATVDAQVGQFNDNLAAVSALLADEREDLAAASSCCRSRSATSPASSGTTRRCCRPTSNRLADVTLSLVQQRSALAEVLDVAPTALGNLAHAYNPDYGTLDTRDNGLGAANAEVVVCGALAQLGRVELQLPVPLPTNPVPLPTTIDAICARLLSGDANADGILDDLNQNGRPDYEELREALIGAIGGGGAAADPGRPAADHGGVG